MDNPFDHLVKESDPKVAFNEKQLKMNELLVSIFRISVNTSNRSAAVDRVDTNGPKVSLKCVSLEDESMGPRVLSFDNLDQLLCERLMVSNINECLIDYPFDKHLVTEYSSKDCEQRVLHYLYECYQKIETMDSPLISTQQRIQLRDTVINQSSLIVCHPEFDPNHSPNAKVSELLELLEDFDDYYDHKTHLQSFIGRVFDRIEAKNASKDEDTTPTMALKPTYDALCERLTRMSLIDPILSRTLNVLNYLVLNGNASKALIQLCSPPNQMVIMTNVYQNTLFGLLLSISCLPRSLNQNFEFFLNPSNYSQQENEMTEKNLGFQLNLLTNRFHSILLSLLKQRETRSQTLEWIEKCLDSFKDRARMWTNEMIMMSGRAQNSSDGFMLNLSSVLLKLCKPFCGPPVTNKLLKVDARYCRLKRSGHKPYLEAIASEPFLTPSDADQINDDNFEASFMTQCFVATHKSLHLGFRVVHERFLKLVRDLNQMQNIYHEMAAQTSDPEAIQTLRTRMDKSVTQFLALKTMLAENEFLETTLNFHISTAIWLNNLALNPNETEASKAFKPLSLPLPRDLDSQCLKSVPEFILENVSDFVAFVKHFGGKNTLSPNIDLKPLMTMIIIFMGSPDRLKNPHLRAKLAEMLESLMPSPNDNNIFSLSRNSEQLFTDHPLKSELIPTLIHVFVSIEISDGLTGETVNVAFEQKFGYRKPMYTVLKYLWSKAEHRKRMKEMADFAQNNMEAISPPLFLRFINLLMNDAIFLLDEALTYMSKLKELQIQRDGGEWAKLPAQQREQNEQNFQHTSRLATFHNIMGCNTIHTLSWITEEIKSIFCDKTLVERMASMLNYFLLHLVGPQNRALKVKDLKQFEFKPKDLVHDICRMYVNLANEDNDKRRKFCLAVGMDDRSYSADLFTLASDVLIKSGFIGLSNETQEVAKLVDKVLQFNKRREIDMEEVPDEFTDPLMSCLMTDPVILPNSGIRIDRSTIARHLLSDQTDPFTRAPLTMDLVVPDTELKQRIKAFIDEKLKAKEQTNKQ